MHTGVLKVFRVSHLEELPKEFANGLGNTASHMRMDEILAICASFNYCFFAVPIIWLAVGSILVLDEISVPFMKWE